MRKVQRVYYYRPYKRRLIRRLTALGLLTAILTTGGIVLERNKSNNEVSINTISSGYADNLPEEEIPVATAEPIVTPQPIIYEQPVVIPEPEPVSTPEPYETGYCTGTEVNVRDYPSTNNTTVLTKIHKGDQVKIYGEENGFYRIEVNGIRGYIAKRYIQCNMVVQTVTIKGKDVRVRSLPQIEDSTIIFEAYNGQTFEYVRDYDKNWVEALYQGQTVYISSKYVVRGETPVNEFQFYKLAYLKRDSSFYRENGEFICSLPQNEVCEVIGEDNNQFHVIVSGIKGYVSKEDCKDFNCTVVIIDLELQQLTVYHNNRIVLTAPFLSGDKYHITPTGVFVNPSLYATYDMRKYGDQTYENVVHLDGDYFMHPGPNVKKNNGKLGQSYPVKGGSHGCIRQYPETAEFIYNLLLNEKNNGNKYIVIIKGPSQVKKVKSVNITPNMYANAKFYQPFVLTSKDAIYHNNSYNSKIKTLNRTKGYC